MTDLLTLTNESIEFWRNAGDKQDDESPLCLALWPNCDRCPVNAVTGARCKGTPMHRFSVSQGDPHAATEAAAFMKMIAQLLEIEPDFEKWNGLALFDSARWAYRMYKLLPKR